jgi:hypothetical protein
MSERINKIDENITDPITRRKAIQKMGYAAFASSTMFLLLNNPSKVYATSTPSGDPSDDLKSGEYKGSKQDEPDAWNTDDDPWK